MIRRLAAGLACAALTLPLSSGALAAGSDAGAEPDVDPGTGAALTLDLPAVSRSDLTRAASVTALADDGTPLPDRQVLVQVRQDDAWVTSTVLVTDVDGSAAGEVTVPRAPASQRWRGVLAPTDTGESGAPGSSDEAGQATVVSPVRSLDLVPWAVRVRRDGRTSVVDGRRLRQTWTVTTGRGDAVPGAEVVVRVRAAGEVERVRRTTDEQGRVVVRDRPRYDSRWAARVRPGTWFEGGRSDVTRVDNLPAGPVVQLPADAPSPRVRVPAQPRALKAGPRPKVTRIPRAVWQEMRGVSWRPGCPVGRADLRLIRVSYWDYTGYARRGEIVVNAATADTVASTFAHLYRARLPIRSMYRVDRFGYSSRLDGGDDFASMAAGNTSGFNCRRVVNYTALSPHAYGFAIDINTWENPYRSRTGLVPNSYWQSRTHPLVAWRSTSHRMIQLLFSHGWSWPYGVGDTQHFSAPARGRYAVAARVAEVAEHELEHGSDADAAAHARGHRDSTGYGPGGVPLD